MIDRFEIRSVSRLKVAIMIPGFNTIFSKGRMSQVLPQQVTFRVNKCKMKKYFIGWDEYKHLRCYRQQ